VQVSGVIFRKPKQIQRETNSSHHNIQYYIATLTLSQAFSDPVMPAPSQCTKGGQSSKKLVRPKRAVLSQDGKSEPKRTRQTQKRKPETVSEDDSSSDQERATRIRVPRKKRSKITQESEEVSDDKPEKDNIEVIDCSDDKGDGDESEVTSV
jgi:hypothetical protein